MNENDRPVPTIYFYEKRRMRGCFELWPTHPCFRLLSRRARKAIKGDDAHKALHLKILPLMVKLRLTRDDKRFLRKVGRLSPDIELLFNAKTKGFLVQAENSKDLLRFAGVLAEHYLGKGVGRVNVCLDGEGVKEYMLLGDHLGELAADDDDFDDQGYVTNPQIIDLAQRLPAV